MFEVGFTEIILIMGLALLVLGPEKLPKLAAQIGRWTGRARSMARQLRAQLDQEVSFQEQRAAHGKGETPATAKAAQPAAAPVADEDVAATAAPTEHVETPASTVSASDPVLKPSNE
jgi:sec-independent protein translocase protein TatB